MTTKMPRSLRREHDASSEKMEDKPASRNESGGLLNTIDKSLDDMRTIITCRVCVRHLYEPFTIECGHTFCYTCLMSWFEKNPASKTCPDCRASVTRKPAPAYLIREMTQLFSNRAELLPVGETTQEHQDQQREEAKVLEEDRQGRGLFRGCFRDDRRRAAGTGNRIIIDDEDGVNRCPRCTWEVEDSECARCGWPGDGESWDGDSVFSMSVEDVLMYRDTDNDDLRVGPETPDRMSTLVSSSEADASNESDDMDDSEDESVGSLNEFVVQDEREQGNQDRARLTRRQFEWRFPRRTSTGRASTGSTDAGTDTLFGRTRDLRRQSEIDADSPPDSSSAEELHTDELSQLSRSPGSRYVDDAGNVQYRRSSGTVRENPTVVNLSDDEDVVPFTPRARNNRILRINQFGTMSETGGHSPPPQVLEVSSDSDQPAQSMWPRRRRNNAGLGPSSSRNSHSTRNDAPQSRTARLRNVMDSDDDADVDEETGQRPPVDQASLQEIASLIGVGPEDEPVAQSQSGERTPHSRLDPTTSIPVRRENVNMPGAFPPSFVSEQGQSQSTPLINFQDLTTPPSPRGNLSTRQARQTQSHDSNSFDRLRREERTHSIQRDQSHRRDRSAAKSARRQDRQRVKATQEARGRSNGEPSVPPSAAS